MWRYLIAIDVGVKNLGFCVFDFTSSTFVEWKTVSLVEGRYVPAHNVKYVRDFVAANQRYFDEAATVVVERQMRCNMRIVEAVLQTLFYDTCIVISPRSVKAHYDLSCKNYRENKQRAVQWVDAFVGQNEVAFQHGLTAAYSHSSKRDDLADSILLALYYLDTYSNQLTNHVVL